jgi:hypothetical protein
MGMAKSGAAGWICEFLGRGHGRGEGKREKDKAQ